MANKKFWLGILVMVLVFGMTVVGCDDFLKPDPATEDNPYELTDGAYTKMTITSVGKDGDSTEWFTFTASSSTVYFLTWDDRYDGSGNYTSDISVSAFMSDGSTILNDINRIGSGYSTPRIISGYSGEVQIKVTSSGTGTYAIKYTADDDGTMETATTFEHGYSWNASIDPNGDVDWYKIEPTGSSYKLSWDDRYDGSGNYDCDIVVSAFTQDGSTIVNDINRIGSGYTTPRTITYTGTVYVKVTGNGTGTYKITCSE